LINAENFKYGKNIISLKEDFIKAPKRSSYKIISLGNSKRQILDIDKLETSYKPIKLSYASTKDEKFFIENKILLHNKRVKITGPQSILDTLEFIVSSPASRKDVVDNKLTLKLLPPHRKILLEQENIVLEISKTEMKIRTISLIPIKYPEHDNITIIPQKISVMVSGPKEIIEKINQRSIEATLDDSNLLNSSTRKVKIKLPTGVNLLEYTPNKIQIIKND
jgi:YbbR domain-containing protein